MNQESREALLKFRADRGWEEYHTKMNLIHAIGVEFGELSRLFQWGKKPERSRVGEEIADMIIYLEYLAYEYCLDMDKEVQDKIKMNAEKYPIGPNHEEINAWNKPCKTNE